MIVSINKDVLTALQHQTLIYLTIITNLGTIASVQPIMDMVSKMAIENIPLEEAEKIVDEIIKNQDEFVGSWNQTIQDIKETHLTREITEEPSTNE